MPKSRVRKKKVYTAPAELRPQSTAAAHRPSPVWVPATAVTLVVLGISWLVVFYLTTGFTEVEVLKPLADLHYWNLAIGFGAMVSALLLFSKWK